VIEGRSAAAGRAAAADHSIVVEAASRGPQPLWWPQHRSGRTLKCSNSPLKSPLFRLVFWLFLLFFTQNIFVYFLDATRFKKSVPHLFTWFIKNELGLATCPKNKGPWHWQIAREIWQGEPASSPQVNIICPQKK
jgi:hypothetical protein